MVGDAANGNTNEVMVPVLAQRKERGWTRLGMARRLRDAADDPKDLPRLETIVHNIHRWESGPEYGVSERYRVLYCRAFEMSEFDLFGTAGAPNKSAGTNATAGCEYVVLAVPKGTHLTVIDLTAIGTGQEVTPRVSDLRLVPRGTSNEDRQSSAVPGR